MSQEVDLFVVTKFFDIFKAGSLELIINNVINEIPNLMKILRSTDAQKYYKTEEDFVLGWVLGRIATRYEEILISLYGRNVDQGEYQEIGNLLKNKLAQIRNKIHETG